MLDERKSAILRQVVAEHIETGQPVGSAHLAREGVIDVSPATIRADMAVLEREGYLTHPHTSAGRVPTELGYRFFVDHLEPGAGLDPVREEQVADFFARAHGELERMLRDTSQLLARLTDYAAVVVAPTREALSICSAMLTRLTDRVGLLVVVLSNGVVDKHSVDLGEDVDEETLERVNHALREQLIGSTLGHLPAPSPTGDSAVEALVRGCFARLGAEAPSAEPGEVFVGGTARMAEQFDAVATVREVLTILEQSFVVVSLLSETLTRAQSVAIGTETGVASLAECSLVVAPYDAGEDVTGSIAVLGPTRMNYAHALAAVALVSKQLGRQLGSG